MYFVYSSAQEITKTIYNMPIKPLSSFTFFEAHKISVIYYVGNNLNHYLLG